MDCFLCPIPDYIKRYQVNQIFGHTPPVGLKVEVMPHVNIFSFVFRVISQVLPLLIK